MRRLTSIRRRISSREVGVCHPRLDRLRMILRVIVATSLLLGRPARLESVRWWRSPTVVASLGLTKAQTQAIDQIYQERLLGRTQCIQRFVEATNQVDRLLRQGLYEGDTLRHTQEVVKAAADERALTRILNDDVAALLSPEQRRSLARLRPGRLVE